MIAVFTRYENMFRRNFTFYPVNKFLRIKSTRDIAGRHFDAVILYADWYESELNIMDAYDTLKQRQPELFNQKH